MKRREFVRLLGAGGMITMAASEILDAVADAGKSRPNILWISIEDVCPHLGCYGDRYAKTPNIDKLALESILYRNAYSNAPICSPSRASIITGMYASTLGAQHHRSLVERPDFLKFFPYYLRQFGYFCTNNQKTDYNMRTLPDEWDQLGRDAHWKNRKTGQPFFSVFNLEESHSSVFYFPREKALKERLFLLEKSDFHDPAQAHIPGFLPDKPIVRERMAQFYDSITQIDYHVGRIVSELHQDHRLEDTIVFLWGDHGSGYPRGKTYLYEEGLHVPLIVRFPEKYRHLAPRIHRRNGGYAFNDRFVLLMDLAPTVLGLAGIPAPKYYQAKAFLGPSQEKPRDFVVGTRDRFDFRNELIRTLRNKRYRYIRNFIPHTPYSTFWPDGGFFAEIPPEGTSEWDFRETSQPVVKIYDPDGAFMAPIPKEKEKVLSWQPRKPFEELYDIEADPDELNNLAGRPEYRSIVNEMRGNLYDWMISTRDLGLIDELEMLIQSENEGNVMYRIGQKCGNFERILETADLCRQGGKNIPELHNRLRDKDPAVRYWAVVGLLTLGCDDSTTIKQYQELMGDSSISVQLAAADALCHFGHVQETLPVFESGIAHPQEWIRGRALANLSYYNKRTLSQMQTLQPLIDEAMQKEPNEIIKVYLMSRVSKRIELSANQ